MKAPTATTLAAVGATLCLVGLVARACAPTSPAVTAPVEAPASSCYEAGQTVPPQRVSLDARCEALRCPAGAHAEWVVTLGRVGNVRCVKESP